jgi:hypothetical protein
MRARYGSLARLAGAGNATLAFPCMGYSHYSAQPSHFSAMVLAVQAALDAGQRQFQAREDPGMIGGALRH